MPLSMFVSFIGSTLISLPSMSMKSLGQTFTAHLRKQHIHSLLCQPTLGSLLSEMTRNDPELAAQSDHLAG